MGRDDEQVGSTVRMPRTVYEHIEQMARRERRSLNWYINELLSEALRARGVEVAAQKEGA